MSTVSFTWFHDIPESIEHEGNFATFSYGDAYMTLVTAKQLLRELNKTEYPKLHAALSAMDPQSLIGFDS